MGQVIARVKPPDDAVVQHDERHGTRQAARSPIDENPALSEQALGKRIVSALPRVPR